MAGTFDPTKYGGRYLDEEETKSKEFDPSKYGGKYLYPEQITERKQAQATVKRVSEGLPISVRKDRVEPTMAGTIAREAIKIPINMGLSIARGPASIFSKKIRENGLTVKSAYLGDTSDYMKEMDKTVDNLSNKVKAGEISKSRAVVGVLGKAGQQTLDMASFVPTSMFAKGLGVAAKGANVAKTPLKQAVKESLVRGGTFGGAYDVSTQAASGEKYKPMQTFGSTALGFGADFGLSRLLPSAISKFTKKPVVSEVAEEAVKPTYKNVVKLGDKNFTVDDISFKVVKEAEEKANIKISEFNKLIDDPNLPQQKRDFYNSQIRKEQNTLDKIKRDATGDYSPTELRSLINKDRKEFTKQGIPDTRTDDEIINKITSKRKQLDGDFNIDEPTINQDIPNQQQTSVEPKIKVDTETPEFKKKVDESSQTLKSMEFRKEDPGAKARHSSKFQEYLDGGNEQHIQDVISKKVYDKDLAPEIAHRLLEQEYALKNQFDKIDEFIKPYVDDVVSAPGQSMSYLNSGLGADSPSLNWKRAERLLESNLKKQGIDIDTVNKEVSDEIANALNDIKAGKDATQTLLDLADKMSC